MKMKACLLVIDSILLNIAFVIAILIRNFGDVSEASFLSYKKSFVVLTLVYILSLYFFGIFGKRFRSSWDLFSKMISGMFTGTLLSIVYVYVLRVQLGTFPTSVFILAFFFGLILIFKVNQRILKSRKLIKRRVFIIGNGKVDEIVGKKAVVVRKQVDQVHELLGFSIIDEIIISEKITDTRDLYLLLYMERKLNADLLFSTSLYMEMLPEAINDNLSGNLFSSFVGRQSDFDEFLIRTLDIVGSLAILLVFWPVILLICLLIKLFSPGPIFYLQQRVGKDGNAFTLFKFRTMVVDAEKMSGLAPTTKKDPRVTKMGFYLRKFRMDELPQLFNILHGKMSLVGPRPENLYRVDKHKALQGIRLAVKPGLTGLAQIRSFYDLQPKHKIKYDFLYIQRRSFFLNVYILLQTIPVVLSKKGW